jgi:hypothetical protein
VSVLAIVEPLDPNQDGRPCLVSLHVPHDLFNELIKHVEGRIGYDARRRPRLG